MYIIITPDLQMQMFPDFFMQGTHTVCAWNYQYVCIDFHTELLYEYCIFCTFAAHI